MAGCAAAPVRQFRMSGELQVSDVSEKGGEKKDAAQYSRANGNDAARVAVLDAIMRNDAVRRTQPKSVAVERCQSRTDEGRATNESWNLLRRQPRIIAPGHVTPPDDGAAEKSSDNKTGNELERPSEPIGTCFHRD